MAKKNKYNVIIKDNVEFKIKRKIKKESTVYTLKRSKSEIWSTSVQGEHILTIEDDGNGMIFKNCNINLEEGLNYGEFFELSLLLDFIKNEDKQLSEKYKIVKVK